MYVLKDAERMMMNKKNRRGDIILLVAGILCLIVFVTTGLLLLNYWYQAWQQQKLNKQLEMLKYGTSSEAMYVIAEPVATPLTEDLPEEIPQGGQLSKGEQQNAEMEDSSAEEQEKEQMRRRLTDINPDYVMWLSIADTEVDYPVVQRDNSYYLKHDFYGKKSSHGTIFLDETCEPEGRFLLLHGHHMKDGTMFGGLKKYKKSEFREQHKALELDWGTKQEHYEIFAGALVDLLQAERFHYEDLPASEEAIKTYLQQLKDIAFWYEEPQWENGEHFVILSTCDYGTTEQRLIVVAVEKK